MQLAINEFIEEQRKGLAELLENLSKSRVAAARNAARQSAVRIKELNGRVRALARSGVRLTAVSQNAAQGLIELHAENPDYKTIVVEPGEPFEIEGLAVGLIRNSFQL